jgi:lipoprotein signal peptidase
MQAARGTPLTGPGAPRDGQPDRPDEPAGPRAAPRRVGTLTAIALAVLAADIATKVTIVATLSDRAPVRLLAGLLTLRVWRNPGAAFSFGPSLTVLFSAIAVGVIIYILRTSQRIRSLAWAVALGLLLGGASGNLTDRIFRFPGPMRGYVVDWIQVPHWPVFNVADSSIVCGGILAVLLAVRGIRIDGSRISGSRMAASRPPDEDDPAGGQATGDVPPDAAARQPPDAAARQSPDDLRPPAAGQGGPPGGGGT